MPRPWPSSVRSPRSSTTSRWRSRSSLPHRLVERRRIRFGEPGVRAAFVVLPMLGAGLAWGVGVATGNLPQPGSDLARLTSLALVMAGPATSVGAVMALAWWPRLVGVVVTGGLVASVFIGRALLGA